MILRGLALTLIILVYLIQAIYLLVIIPEFVRFYNDLQLMLPVPTTWLANLSYEATGLWPLTLLVLAVAATAHGLLLRAGRKAGFWLASLIALIGMGLLAMQTVWLFVPMVQLQGGLRAKAEAPER